MASEVKWAHLGILKILSSFESLPSEPGDLRLLVCTTFFIAGLLPEGCTKQLIEVKAARPFAWAADWAVSGKGGVLVSQNRTNWSAVSTRVPGTEALESFGMAAQGLTMIPQSICALPLTMASITVV